MNVRRRSLVLALVAGMGLIMEAPAGAWTQIDNGGSTTAPCSPCYKIQANVPHLYRTSSATWNSNWNGALASAFQGWNALRPPALNPVWSSTTTAGSEAILLGQGHLGPAQCGVTSSSFVGSSITYSTITINLDTVQTTSFVNSTTCYINNTLAHEIGHGGEALSHSRIDGNLMLPNPSSRIAPGPDDYNGIRAIYG